ncbi:hypothetical protein EPUL_000544 [Erysiphe pulchra]|uniref:DUF2470 domain-containing protein n=1 Tax=Erysiphe pulchra TaxID=225359 RepID=A0A2S4PYP7_9PEZI|nr:hypothetical protein EPUL_000544 [Erysiphe pulchra]
MADFKVEVNKDRIINHMNTDHADSPSLFLQYFLQVPPQEAQYASIYDISLSTVSIKTVNSKNYTVPLDPPMKSWSETREKMKEMDRVARQSLGIQDINYVPYKFPTSPLHVSVFSACAITFLIFGLTYRGNFFVPGRYVYDKILPFFPGGADTFLIIVKLLAIPTLVIHTGEVLYLNKTRLQKNGIKRGSFLWWCWFLSCYTEGFGSFQRFDKELKRIKVNSKNQKL